ncbi:hypothetical protein EJB05_36600, partial [Eragrostis curvula]
MKEAQKAEAIRLSLAGLRPCQIMDVMEKSHGGAPGAAGFLCQDMYNFIARQKKEKVHGSDAEYVLNFMDGKKEEDPEFFFKYNKDDEGRLQNIFWSDSQSQVDYEAFGDVVVFDSTYRVNRYNLPFVPFVGLDNHRKTVMFGCGILSNETVASYVWLLQAFLEAMRQRHPRSVITDGDLAMAKAIEVMMPGADHRLCSWHIEQNMVKRLRGNKLKEFRRFIYTHMDVEQFEREWAEYRSRHKITENDLWMGMLYELRKKWSTAYTKGRYFLGMVSNQRSESLNARLHKHLERRMSLIDLVEHFQACTVSTRRRQIELDAQAQHGVKFTDRSADPFEKRVARIFTPDMFPKVKEQVRRLHKWKVTEVTLDNGFLLHEVSSIENTSRRVQVRCTFEGALLVNATCQCRMMESEAIACGHIFCVLRHNNVVEEIPAFCISLRWTKEAKKAFQTELGISTQVWSEQMDRFHALRNKGNCALFKASKSEAETERVMQFFDGIMSKEIENNGSAHATSFGPLPTHFSAAHRSSTSGVLDPKKIISKGAPSLRKRWKAYPEFWRTN